MARRDRADGLRCLAAALALVAVALACVITSGCASTILSAGGAATELSAIDAPRFERRSADVVAPQVALVLSGGSARAFAHLGVLRVLEREGLRPDLVVGTSAGAIVGALYASGRRISDIEALVASIDWPTLIDIDPVKALLGGFGLGLARGDRLEAFLRQAIGVPLQRLQIPFVAVATDLNTGDSVLLNHGDAARALRASSALPGLYEPVRSGERLLGDGQVVSPLPVSAARTLGAQVVVAVDVVYPPQHALLTNPVSVLFQTVTISTWRHLLVERGKADVLVRPEIPPGGNLALSDREWLIAAGQRAAESMLPQLRLAFARP